MNLELELDYKSLQNRFENYMVNICEKYNGTSLITECINEIKNEYPYTRQLILDMEINKESVIENKMIIIWCTKNIIKYIDYNPSS